MSFYKLVRLQERSSIINISIETSTLFFEGNPGNSFERYQGTPLLLGVEII
jgi:hypothetical protein